MRVEAEELGRTSITDIGIEKIGLNDLVLEGIGEKSTAPGVRV